MILETERLFIRSIKPEDEQAFIEMASDGSLTEIYGDCSQCHVWMGDFIRDAIRSEAENNPRKDWIACAITDKNSRQVIGSVGCSWYEDLDRIGITYFIGSGFRGHGYAAEAVRAYVDFFFRTYKEDRLFATAMVKNRASCKTLERAGFVLTDTRMYQDLYDEKEELSHFFEITREAAKLS